MNQWVSKTFRVRKEALDVIAFFIYDGMKKKIAKEKLFNYVINFSLSYLENNNIDFQIDPYEERRVIRGYKVDPDLWNRLKSFQTKHRLEVGESIELCLYIYASKVFPLETIINLGLDMWGIRYFEK